MPLAEDHLINYDLLVENVKENNFYCLNVLIMHMLDWNYLQEVCQNTSQTGKEEVQLEGRQSP